MSLEAMYCVTVRQAAPQMSMGSVSALTEYGGGTTVQSLRGEVGVTWPEGYI